MNRRHSLSLLAIAICTMSMAGVAGAAEPISAYPSKPIRLIIPFSPGGATDILGRILAATMSRQMGQTIVIENKAGAAGNIANEIVAKAQPDGYTLLLNTSSIALSAALYKKLNYNVRTDFTAVILVSVVPLVLSVNPALPIHTVNDLIAYAKARPTELSYGSAGSGTLTHLAPFMLLQSKGITATHVPYKGSSPSVMATAGGDTQFNFEPLTVALPLIRGKRLRPLAVSTSERVPTLPDVPTVQESGLAGFETGAWQGILAPAKTPKPIVDRLNAEVLKALNDPDVKTKFLEQGAQILGGTPQQYETYLIKETDRWNSVVKASGVSLD
jgi:tripartite-type tricarboxylate transporter receptor subunit TctC